MGLDSEGTFFNRAECGVSYTTAETIEDLKRSFGLNLNKLALFFITEVVCTITYSSDKGDFTNMPQWSTDGTFQFCLYSKLLSRGFGPLVSTSVN